MQDNLNININDIINESLKLEDNKPELPIKKNKGGGGPGGARPNAGRKTKAEEFALIDMIRKHIDDDDAMAVLAEMVMSGNINAFKLYMNYRYGLPKEKVDITTNGKDIGIPVIKFFDTDDKDK